MDSFLAQLAGALAAIHATDAGLAALHAYAPYFDPRRDGERRPPAWSRDSAMWERAFALLTEPSPTSQRGFIHRDYHQGQTLWLRGRLSGVVDWTTGCQGPLGIDLARVRLNLAGDFGLDVAEGFLHAHTAVVGDDLHEPYWDLLDVADLLLDMPTPQCKREAERYARLEAWAARALAETK
jgi:Ser/Thr protein kinase RdoA (MazF antagonist)